jgi:hypothetical protein
LRKTRPIADRVGEDDAVGAGRRDLAGDAAHPVLVDIALDRAAERGRKAAIDLHPLAAVAAELDDASEILDRFAGATPYVGKIVALADRQHEIHLVHPEREPALGAARIGDQRRDGEVR